MSSDSCPTVVRSKTSTEESTGTVKAEKRLYADDMDSKLNPLYKTDAFRIERFKISPCSKRYSHDWGACPFAHPGERARRRDLKLYTYQGIACPNMKKTSSCSAGDNCAFAHNVFEYWLHPHRYRTQTCNDGPACTRHVCFFAHSMEEMRATPGKKEPHPTGSPDTPFLSASSALATDSSASDSCSPHVLASTAATDGDAHGQARSDPVPQSGGMDSVVSTLTKVKQAVARGGGGQDDVINMLSRLLHEAVEENKMEKEARRASGDLEAQLSYKAGFQEALRAVDRSQARVQRRYQDLLASRSQREREGGYLGASHLHEQRPSSELQQAIQEMLDGMQTDPDAQRADDLLRRHQAGNQLFSAPAALEATLNRTHSCGSPAPAAGHFLGSSGGPSRMLSTDIGASLFGGHGLWQGAAQSDLRSLPSDEPWTVASQRDNDAEVVGGLRLGQTTFIDGGLRLGQTLNPNSREPMAAASANPGALRRQGFDFAEARPGGTGMASAFQKAALEDWAPAADEGRTSRMASTDLGAMLGQNLTELYYQSPQLGNALPLLEQRTRKDSGMHLLTAPLAYHGPQQAAGNPAALLSAPCNLGLSHSSGALDAVDYGTLQNWGWTGGHFSDKI